MRIHEEQQQIHSQNFGMHPGASSDKRVKSSLPSQQHIHEETPLYPHSFTPTRDRINSSVDTMGMTSLQLTSPTTQTPTAQTPTHGISAFEVQCANTFTKEANDDEGPPDLSSIGDINSFLYQLWVTKKDLACKGNAMVDKWFNQNKIIEGLYERIARLEFMLNNVNNQQQQPRQQNGKLHEFILFS